jgi:DNA-binding MarR family transcriptional regulator
MIENNSVLFTTLQEWVAMFARRSIHDFMRFARQNGLSMAQINVLLRLHYRGAATIAALRLEATGSRAAASQMIDELVRSGLVERREDVKDRRLKVVSLTEAGHELVRAGIAARQRWLDQMIAAQPEERHEEINRVMRWMLESALAIEKSGQAEPTGELQPDQENGKGRE